MKIVDAVWDTVNLGKKTYEITIDNSDPIESIEKSLADVDGEYLVVKIQSDNVPVSMLLQSLGYYFVEEQVLMEHDLKIVARSSLMQRLYDSMTYSIMTDPEVEMLISEVQNGLFSTDRISLDPKFGQEYSVRRYVNWIRQLRQNGAFLYSLKYKGDYEGFVILKESKKDNEYESVLGGAYQKYRCSGLGLVQKEQEIVRERGGKRLYTTVSTNNVGQLKALVFNGYSLAKVTRVFVKHISK